MCELSPCYYSCDHRYNWLLSSGRGGAGLTSSLLLTVSLPAAPAPAMPAVVGWERTEKGQLGPRLADMRSSLDPTRVAEQSVDLNLKLMKWRLVPDLDLAKLQVLSLFDNIDDYLVTT